MAHIFDKNHISTTEFLERRKDIDQCLDHLLALEERFNAFRFTWEKDIKLSKTSRAKEIIIELRNELEKFKIMKGSSE